MTIKLFLAIPFCLSLFVTAPLAQDITTEEVLPAIGKTFQLSETGDWLGAPVVPKAPHTYVAVLWGGSWCPPCVRMLSDMVALDRDYNEKSVVLYGVVADSRKRAERALEGVPGLDLPTLLLEQREFSELTRPFAVQRYPAVIVHDAQGTILALGDPRNAAGFAPAFPLPPGIRPGLLPLRGALDGGSSIDPAILATATQLEGDLKLARSAGDKELVLELLAELALLAPPFAHHGVARLGLLLTDSAQKGDAWDYGLSLLRAHGRVPEVIALLEARCILPRVTGQEGGIGLARYETLIELGPEFDYLAIHAYRERAKRDLDASSYGRGLLKRFENRAPELLSLAQVSSDGKDGADDTELARAAANAACAASEDKNVKALLLSSELAFSAKDYGQAIARLRTAVPLAPQARQEELKERLRYFELKARRSGR
jgi:thiol-disulfide isomerase/thioredoxin